MASKPQLKVWACKTCGAPVGFEWIIGLEWGAHRTCDDSCADADKPPLIYLFKQLVLN
jgi:hypothetical protein